MIDEAANEFAKLVDVVAELRGENGCPWDKKQTHDSLRPYLVEETYEVLDAIDHGSDGKLKEELGDVLLQALLHAELARERGAFDIGDVCRVIREKLIRRHPHVFGEVKVSGVEDVLHNWEVIKAGEPGYEDRKSALDGVPKSLPALIRATEISKRASKVGFDWPKVTDILDKLREESEELSEAIASGRTEDVSREIGDTLFVIVNVARYLGIDAEDSLREMLDRFSSRFGQIEERARSTGRQVSDMTLEEMDAVWDEAKRSG
ncbi:MAG: nucleoside triphosphate pyrophosphohydrolase [Armatimonadota bacterium]|nr:nucleoside triphosphate pyrophosphohydrolase [Armatimonadota bacterium]